LIFLLLLEAVAGVLQVVVVVAQAAIEHQLEHLVVVDLLNLR
tara:strand:+ start:2965 stop:3090 length:126 start_codon:yes stop_codon:yes gene_type:complete